MLKKWLTSTIKYSLELGRCGWGFLLAVGLAHHILSMVLDQFGPPISTAGPNIPLIICTIISDTTLSFLVTIFSLRRLFEHQNGLKLSSPSSILRKYGRDLAAEWLRVAAGVVKGLILLIIPGFIRMWRWALVSPIVVLDPVYAEGGRNALEHSAHLAKGVVRWFALIWILSMGVEFAVMQAGEINFEFEASNWAWQGLLDLVSLLMLIVTNVVVYVIYLDQKGESQ